VTQEFIAVSRTAAAVCIKAGAFSNAAVELASVCKFVGTGFACDTVAALRKVMGSEALFARSRLGIESDVFLATCFAEGDNAIMEQKVVLDTALGRTARVPLSAVAAVVWRLPWTVAQYLRKLSQAMLLGKQAQFEPQLLRDIAWSKANLLVLEQWFRRRGAAPESQAFFESYERVLLRLPVPVIF